MIGVIVGFAAEARLAAALGPVAVGGDRPGTAAAAARLVRSGVRGLLSFGLAGGLDPALAAGALVRPLAVVTADGRRWQADLALAARLGPAEGLMLAADEVIGSRAAKRAAFAETGAVAVDLESGIVAAAAAAHGLPFAVLRAVCDPAGRELPPAALCALDAAGHIRVGALLGSLGRQPGQIGALIALGREAARARAALLARAAAIGRLD